MQRGSASGHPLRRDVDPDVHRLHGRRRDPNCGHEVVAVCPRVCGGTIRGTKRTGLHLATPGPGGNADQSQCRLHSGRTGLPRPYALPFHTREAVGSNPTAPITSISSSASFKQFGCNEQALAHPLDRRARGPGPRVLAPAELRDWARGFRLVEAVDERSGRHDCNVLEAGFEQVTIARDKRARIR
jgi:hypothetical protein